MTESNVARIPISLLGDNWETILTSPRVRAHDTGYTERFAGTTIPESILVQWLMKVAQREVAQQLQPVRTHLETYLETYEERIATLEQQMQSTDIGVVLYRPIPVIQTTRERLWAMGQEGRSRALEYDGDPIEDLHRILPEALSAEEWQNIISGAYD